MVLPTSSSGSNLPQNMPFDTGPVYSQKESPAQENLPGTNPRVVPSLTLSNLPIPNEAAMTLSRTNSTANSSRNNELRTKDAFIGVQEERLLEKDSLIRIQALEIERLTEQVKLLERINEEKNSSIDLLTQQLKSLEKIIAERNEEMELLAQKV